MEGAPDNEHPDSLYRADLDEVAHKLARIVRQIHPHVVITHDAAGGYFHPDHMKVHQAVRRAWANLAETDGCSESQDKDDEAWRPGRLYCSVIPRSALKWFVFFIRLRGRDPRRFGLNQDVDLTQVGVPDDQIQVRLDVGHYVSVKEQAGRCHQSQGGGGAQRWLPAFIRRRFLRFEFFVQLEPPGAGPHSDLFEGLDEA
jgi:LmbE family N-acetylglucosaminyl deacetylase